MPPKTYPPTKDRRDIGTVVTAMDKMMAARELSSCCIGVEAMLESSAGFDLAPGALSDFVKSKLKGS